MRVQLAHQPRRQPPHGLAHLVLAQPGRRAEPVHDGGALGTLVRALRDDPTAALAGGCYEEFSAARGAKRFRKNCFDMNFWPSEDGGAPTLVLPGARLDMYGAYPSDELRSAVLVPPAAGRHLCFDGR